jgi:hypothetical protein
VYFPTKSVFYASTSKRGQEEEDVHCTRVPIALYRHTHKTHTDTLTVKIIVGRLAGSHGASSHLAVHVHGFVCVSVCVCLCFVSRRGVIVAGWLLGCYM